MPWIWLCFSRQVPLLMKRPVIQVMFSLVSPFNREQVIVVKVIMSVFASLFFFLPLPLTPVPLPPRRPETNISKHPTLCCLHARSQPSGPWVIVTVHGEGIFQQLPFPFLPHRLRSFWSHTKTVIYWIFKIKNELLKTNDSILSIHPILCYPDISVMPQNIQILETPSDKNQKSKDLVWP